MQIYADKKPGRMQLKQQFIQENNWEMARIAPLAGDASNRKYDRLFATHNDSTAILMDASPALDEDVKPFIALTGWLRTNGFNAPDIIGYDIENGFILLEDFGDSLFVRTIKDKIATENTCYTAALDVLVHLNNYPVIDTVAGYGIEHTPGTYDIQTYLREATLCVEWYGSAIVGKSLLDSSAKEDFHSIITATCTPYTSSNVLSLRDYHAENLLWLSERTGLHRVGLLDYQDALWGQPEYDLVSLLEDARRDVSDHIQLAIKKEFSVRTGKSYTDVEAACAVLGAQRNLKILGIFVRLNERDNKNTYLKYLMRVWNYLEQDLQHDALTDLRHWVEETLLPPDKYYEKHTV